jgi:hypothetical protein
VSDRLLDGAARSLRSPAGAEHVINVAVSFSTQRKAEMSSFGDYAAHFSPTLDEVSTL